MTIQRFYPALDICTVQLGPDYECRAVRSGQGLTIPSITAHLIFHHGFLLAKEITISVIYIGIFRIHQ